MSKCYILRAETLPDFETRAYNVSPPQFWLRNRVKALRQNRNIMFWLRNRIKALRQNRNTILANVLTLCYKPALRRVRGVQSIHRSITVF